MKNIATKLDKELSWVRLSSKLVNQLDNQLYSKLHDILLIKLNASSHITVYAQLKRELN